MPIDAYIIDWLNLILRWTHVITGIAWIGSSFYFIWLDLRLNVPPRDPESKDVAGDLWAVHGGGFYHSQKYKVAPEKLPEPLHWFKWEAYWTWMTGFALYIVVYYINASALLIDPAVVDMKPATAILTSIGLLVAGWLVYDGLCRSGLSDRGLSIIGSLLVLGLCWGVCQLYAGRGAFLQVGAMLGTIMVANVWRIIIPSQKQLVAAKLKGEAPDARLGARAKQRSVHNNYLTLPVVFTMISPHFALAYSHQYNWLVLFVIFAGAALVRHFFNLRNQGRPVIALPAVATAILVVLAVVLMPRLESPVPRVETASLAPADATRATFDDVHRIVQARCLLCHSVNATHPTAPAAAIVKLDTTREIETWAPRIFERVVVTKTMPLANLTGMTDQERVAIQSWYAAGASVD
jgi:uncharacterized membrane protein